MVDTSVDAQLRLHLIAYLDWVREGVATFDAQRAELLNILAQLVETLSNDNNTIQHFLLGGQTILLSDIANVGESLLDAIAELNASGRVGIGAFYVQTDGLLSNGEALVRNLLIGRADAKRYGMNLSPIAFLPDVHQQNAQLPQILKNFDIDAVFMGVGNPVIPLPFRWDAPDNSNVLVITYHQQDEPLVAIETQRKGQPDGPLLWIHQAQSPDSLSLNTPDTPDDVAVSRSDLKAYTKELREKLPDTLRPALAGELHLQQDRELSGRFSARVSHKVQTAKQQATLLHIAEPLLALALTQGKVRFPEIQRALLDYTWRLLLQNQSRTLMAGAVSDEVQAEANIRHRRIADNTERLIETSLDTLDGKRTTKSKATDETYIVVWNTHAFPVKQITEVKLKLPTGMYPNMLIDANGDERAFHWDSRTQELGFLAHAPSLGYATYTLRLSTERTAAYNQKRTVAARTIGSASGESLGINNGRLDWTYEGYTITDLLSYYDGGDAGDVWHYAEPQPDVVMRGSLVDVVQVEATPTYERLIFRNRMRIAPELKDGKSRGRGLRVLDLTTSATYYHDLKGLYFRTKFNNSANDHHLRAHLRTELDATVLFTDTAFGMVKRSLSGDDANMGMQAMQSVAALYNNDRGLALFGRGLHALEPVRDESQVTLALTMLRATGWIDKAQAIAAEGAQAQGDYIHEFMLMPVEGDRDMTVLLRNAQAYQAPLRAYQYDDAPRIMSNSYLSIDDERVIVTAVKPPQRGEGMVVRLTNPTPADIGLHLQAFGIQQATRITMAEVYLDDYTVNNGQVNITLEPHQAVTIHLGF